jgi:hypothetical protein
MIEIKITADSRDHALRFFAGPNALNILRAMIPGAAPEDESREARWLRQGLLNTPEENAKANQGKGVVNAPAGDTVPPSCLGCVYFIPERKPNPDAHGGCIHPSENGLYARIWFGRNAPPPGCPLRPPEAVAARERILNRAINATGYPED